LSLALDALIVVTMVAVALRALFARELFTGVVLYIVFGLLMSLAWVRLRAPDIALAEAAIGAGLTGALLIMAAAHSSRGAARRWGGARGALTSAAAAMLTALLIASALVPAAAGLGGEVAQALDATGVTHPVTAVLLNLRAYDTWLETGVLLLAVLGSRALGAPATRGATLVRDPVTDGLLAIMMPLMLLVAGFLLWLGTGAPGGAFQAGAVLGSAGVLVLIIRRYAPVLDEAVPRVLLVAGFAAFSVAAVVPLLFRRSLLEFRGATAGYAIMAVEIAVMITVAAALVLLFGAARDAGSERRRQGKAAS
jgi:multisubunit Na+/H+ antiporter MnhB subunit